MNRNFSVTARDEAQIILDSVIEWHDGNESRTVWDIKNSLSGSIEELVEIYGVSYPLSEQQGQSISHIITYGIVFKDVQPDGSFSTAEIA